MITLQPVIPWAVGFVVRPGRLAVLCFWAAILCGLIRVLWTSYNPRDGTAPPVDDTNSKGGTVDRHRQLLFRKAFHILAVLMFTPVSCSFRPWGFVLVAVCRRARVAYYSYVCAPNRSLDCCCATGSRCGPTLLEFQLFCRIRLHGPV